MKALAIDEYGVPSVLQVRELDRPAIDPEGGRVLVRVSHSSINPIDWKFRRGDFRLILAKKFPRVLGVDFAGEVAEVGARAGRFFKVGDQVFGMCNPMHGQHGSYAEFAVADYDSMTKLPDGLLPDQAASLPVAGLTALKGLRQLMGLPQVARVLINGASGGVGSFAVQIAKNDGHYVVATCSPSNFEFVKSLGADQVFDYADFDVSASQKQFDGVLDASAKLSFAIVNKALTASGVYVTTVPDKGSIAPIVLSKILPFPGKKAKLVMAGSGNHVAAELKELAELVTSGRVRPIVDRTITLEDVAQAHETAEKGHSRGKTVIRVG